MHRKIKSHIKSIKPVTLYLDDLEQIVEILHQASDSVRISTEDFDLENPKELTELKRESFN